MANGLIALTEVATGEQLWRWPVDAREMIALGVCRPADAEAEAVASGLSAFPLTGNARRTATPMTPEHVAPTVLADVTERPKRAK